MEGMDEQLERVEEEEVEEGPYSAHALLTKQREPGVRPLPPS